MAELLIRVVDKVNLDVNLNYQCTKRGDVIAVCPDGWNWSTTERKNPDWRIMRFNVTDPVALSLTAPQDDGKITTDPGKSKKLLKRANSVNVDFPGLSVAIKNAIADSSRAVPIIDATSQNIVPLINSKAFL
jgi:hypothetical protein